VNAKNSQSAVNTISLPVSGMSCASCVGRVEQAIAGVTGTGSAKVNLATETATVTIADNSDVPAVLEALDAAGYPAVRQTEQLSIGGMGCASCVGKIEDALRGVPGVIDVTVNLATENATVSTAAGTVPANLLQDAVNAAGFTVNATQGAQTNSTAERSQRKQQEATELRSASLLAGALTLPVFLLEMGSHFIPGVHELIGRTLGHGNSWWLQFILITLVLAIPGRRFFTSGVPALLAGRPDMNSLVVLGTVAAWSYSVLALFAPSIFPDGTRAVYFEAAGVITTLILTGRYLEARAKGRTGAAIERLLELQPKTALVGDTLQSAIETDISKIRVDDTIHVRPGERIAVDGKVIHGESFVDESMITGEPIPVERTADSHLIGGTINGNGALSYRATAIGADTVLAQIVQLVEDAQGARLPIQAMVDRVTGIFVPVVIGIALLTVLLWLLFGPTPALALALVSGVSVLIIACPCAMGLATPTSIMVGTGRAAELGVLFRKGDALQALQQIDLVALDKTGTITEGRPQMTSLSLANGYTREQVMPILGAVESNSEHPIAHAITAAASQLLSKTPSVSEITLPVAENYTAIPGLGAEATVNGQQVLIGSGRFMQSQSIDLKPLGTLSDHVSGETRIYAAIDNVAVAAISVSDPIKEGSVSAISALHDLGLQVAMISGDSKDTADAIAAQTGIDQVIAEVLPAEKLDAVDQLRNKGRKVAFVGDGINDAPALAQADIGIALGTGSDVAIESADVILMSGDLRGVVNALDLSKKTMRNIRQNLFWAFAYNAALIPVAAGALYHSFGWLLSPMLAAAAMALSSVFVVSNALRLRKVSARQPLTS
jgi:Cu+-exporting ATPase